MRKRISFPFGVRPVNVVSHFVIDNINPLPLGVIFPSSFPIFRVDKVNATVLVSLSRGLPPIEIFKPLYLRPLQAIKLAHPRHGAAKIENAIVLEETGKITVYDSTFLNRRKNHAHKDSLIGTNWANNKKILPERYQNSSRHSPYKYLRLTCDGNAIRHLMRHFH